MSFWKSATDGVNWPVAIITAAILFLVLLGSYFITSSIIETAHKETPPPANIATPAPDQKETSDYVGRGIAFTLLFLALVGVCIATWKENRGDKNSKIPWSKILLQPVFVSMAGVMILNAMVNLFTLPVWQWFWSKQVLLWGTNISIILYAFFKTKKEPYAKYVAQAIGFLILCGFVTTIYKDHKGENWIPTGSSIIPNQRRLANISSQINAPTEIILPIIAGCESGGRQFGDDGKTPVRNPKNPDAVGKWQINLADPAIAKLVKEKNWDVEHSEADNKAAAELLFQENGTRPWEASQGCWEPKLASLGFGGSRGETPNLLAVKAPPIGAFSEEVAVPPGFKADWGGSEGPLLVVNDRGLSARYDPEKGVIENIPPPSQMVRFQSLSDKVAVVRLKFTKI